MYHCKAILFMMACFACCATAKAQRDTVPLEYDPLLHNAWTLSVGSHTLRDDYLSPLDYYGSYFQWEGDHRQFFKKKERLSFQNRNTITFFSAINRPATAQIIMLSGNWGYGVSYHFRPVRQLHIALGGLTDLNLGVKYQGRNVNNPVSVDAAIQLHAAALIRYHWVVKRFQIGLQYELSTPLIGAMFVPEYGASYYEFSLGSWDNAFHLSSLHNRYGIKSILSIDFEFKKFTLRASAKHYNQQWEANYLNFSINQVGFGIGAVIDMRLFSGREAHCTDNYRSIWE